RSWEESLRSFLARGTGRAVRADERSGAGGGGRDQLERASSAVVREEALAAAEHDRFDHQAVLVDEVVADEGRCEAGAAHDLDVAAALGSRPSHRTADL